MSWYLVQDVNIKLAPWPHNSQEIGKPDDTSYHLLELAWSCDDRKLTQESDRKQYMKQMGSKELSITNNNDQQCTKSFMANASMLFIRKMQRDLKQNLQRFQTSNTEDTPSCLAHWSGADVHTNVFNITTPSTSSWYQQIKLSVAAAKFRDLEV